MTSLISVLNEEELKEILIEEMQRNQHMEITMGAVCCTFREYITEKKFKFQLLPTIKKSRSGDYEYHKLIAFTCISKQNQTMSS